MIVIVNTEIIFVRLESCKHIEKVFLAQGNNGLSVTGF